MKKLKAIIIIISFIFILLCNNLFAGEGLDLMSHGWGQFKLGMDIKDLEKLYKEKLKADLPWKYLNRSKAFEIGYLWEGIQEDADNLAYYHSNYIVKKDIKVVKKAQMLYESDNFDITDCFGVILKKIKIVTVESDPTIEEIKWINIKLIFFDEKLIGLILELKDNSVLEEYEKPSKKISKR